MGIAVLGPLRVDGHADGLSPRDRVVLSALVVHAREPVSTEALADALWGDAPPASWAKVVAGCVWRLRTALGPAAIDTAAAGYVLTLGDDELDHRLFERLLDRARIALWGEDPARASFLLEEALALWRGRALTDVEEWGPGQLESARLEGMRMDAEELRVEAEVRLGRGPAVLERTRALVAQAPFREHRWALLATSLYQSGRQREALGVLQRARSELVEELGLDPGRELVELEQRLLRQDASLWPVAPEVAAACPYRGLLPYGAEDSDVYFGREEDLAACLRRLRDTGVLVVVAPSGAGKSSLLRAGVVAALARADSPVVVRTPGAHPMAALDGVGHRTLVVDQLEEAVTLCTDPAERESFFDALAAHSATGAGLVLALRADHLGDLAPFASVAHFVESGLHLLGPMREEDLRRAIEGPARRAGLRLEPGLVDLLVREIEGQPAGLPMLSHVLQETWERREGATLTIDGYKATGGIKDAVARSAEALYDSLDPARQSLLRGLLLRLVVPVEDGEPVRTRVARERVVGDPEHRRLVESLVEARLLSIDGDSVQIAHEALVRVWPRLRGWLEDDIEGQRLLRHLAGAAEAWDSAGRPESELYRGARLERTLEWRMRSAPDLDDVETAFLEASSAYSEEERRTVAERVARDRRANRRLRAALAGVGALLTVSVVAATLALRSAERAEEQQSRAERSAALADAGRLSAQALNERSPATSLLLELQAVRLEPTAAQAWDNLATTLSRPDVPRRIAPGTGRLGYILSLDASDDGRLIATNDPVDGVQLHALDGLAPIPFGDDTPASAVAFSPDGHLLAAAVNQWQLQTSTPRIVDRPVRLYDVPEGRVSARQLGGWPVGANVEYSLSFSRDGTRLAAGVNVWDAVARDWRTTGAALVWEVGRPERPVLDAAVPDGSVVALSPDGRRLYVGSTGEPTIRVFDVGTGRLSRSAAVNAGPAATPRDVEVSPDGSMVALGTTSGVMILDAMTLAPTARLPHAGDSLVAWSHDGSMLLATSEEGEGVLWDTASWTERRRFGRSFADGAFAPDDRAVITGGESELAVWDVSGASALLLPAGAGTDGGGSERSLPSPDARRVARAAADRLWFVDASTGQATTPAATARTVWAGAWSPDSRWFLTTSPGLLSLWDPRTGRLAREHRDAAGLGVSAAFSPAGERILVPAEAGTLLLLDRATLRSVATLDAGGPVLAVLPDTRDDTVIALRPDGSVARLDPSTGAVLAHGPAGQVAVEAEHPGALSPDGTRLVAMDPAGGVRLLDTRTFAWVNSGATQLWGDNVAYAGDGSQFASADSGRVRLWDGRTGAYLAGIPLPGPQSETRVAYAADSRTLLVAADDGRTWTLDTDRASWVELACRIAGRNLTREEWTLHLKGRDYEATCPQWPAGT